MDEGSVASFVTCTVLLALALTSSPDLGRLASLRSAQFESQELLRNILEHVGGTSPRPGESSSRPPCVIDLDSSGQNSAGLKDGSGRPEPSLAAGDNLVMPRMEDVEGGSASVQGDIEDLKKDVKRIVEMLSEIAKPREGDADHVTPFAHSEGSAAGGLLPASAPGITIDWILRSTSCLFAWADSDSAIIWMSAKSPSTGAITSNALAPEMSGSAPGR